MVSIAEHNFVSRLVADLIQHEGYMRQVYADSLGYKTFGIGHLVHAFDPEADKKVGSYVSDFRIAECFFRDVSTAIDTAHDLFPALHLYPENVVRVLINMAFNLGYDRLSKFKKMIAAVHKQDWNKAADEMMDSLWYKQVKTRGVELVEMMRSAA